MGTCGHARAADLATTSRGAPRVYERHDVGADTLHQVVRENLQTFLAAIEAGFAGGRLPSFVEDELSGYLRCTVLGRGFAHLACEGCGLVRLVAFTCAGRGFCPTCAGRRMNQTSINVLGHVLPPQPLRQWVLTLPYELRAPFGGTRWSRLCPVPSIHPPRPSASTRIRFAIRAVVARWAADRGAGGFRDSAQYIKRGCLDEN